MAKTAVYDYSTTAASNSDFDGTDSSGATGKVKDGDNYARSIASHVKGFALDLGAANTVAGTGDAITVTLASAPTALVDGMRISVNAPGTNTTAVTIAVTNSAAASLGTKKIRKWAAGVETALSAGDITQNHILNLVYDSARDTGAGCFMIDGSASVAAATTSAAGIVALNYFGIAQNIGFAASVGSSALTIALKGADGNDPSASNPVIIPFRNVTAATGTPSFLTVTAATSIVISSGSTLGMTSGVAATLAIVGFNDGGTFRLGLINPLVRPLNDGIASSTAEGGAGAADSAGVIYTGTAVASKAMTVLGYATVTEATAGTWATAPATLKLASAPEVNGVLPIVTPWVTYTPTFTGFGTAASISMWSRRVGDTLEIRGNFTSGTPTTTEGRMSLGFNGTNGNVTSDATKVPALQAAGNILRNVSGAVTYYTAIESNVGYIVFTAQSGATNALAKLNADSLAGAGTAFSLQAAVPISGW